MEARQTLIQDMLEMTLARELAASSKIWWSKSGTKTITSKYFCEPSAASVLLDSLISLYEPRVLTLGDLKC